MNIRVLIADDHAIVREGFRALIDQQADMQVVGEAENGRKAVLLAKRLLPDVIIMDVSMPDLNGIDATHQIRSEVPKTKIIALSMHSDKRFVSGMLKAGVSGFLLKECAFRELTTAIHAAVAGGHYLSPKIAATVVQDYVRQTDALPASSSQPLTLREREVLQMLAEGGNTRDIAAALHISVKTVEARRRSIMEKLRITTLADLIKYALREGLTSL
ncbi:response regulator [Desulfococcus sp.]|uniref:response regulator n=1 Tax=Desulfococcus sp. TaxID=2025834 RepID=UPI003593644D